MEIRAYLRLFRRWLWLIALAAVVAGAFAYNQSRTQPLRYQASSMLMVGSFLNMTDPSIAVIQTGVQLAQNYAEIVKTYPVLKGTVDSLNLPMSPEEVRGMFTTGLVSNTSLLVLTVTTTEPILAADVANTLAEQLIANSPTNTTIAQQEQERTVQSEIDTLRTQLADIRAELARINDGLGAPTLTAEARTELETRRTALQDREQKLQALLSNFSQTLAGLRVRSDVNVLSIVERATVPLSPLGTNTFTVTFLAAVVGAILAASAAVVIEYFNDSLRSPSEVTPLLGVNLLGTIAPFGKRNIYNDKLIVWTQPRSTIAEAYRAVRVNLMHQARDEDGQMRHVYMVTSPSPSEGKSVTTANLAVTFASTGMQVLLIDADLRRPTQHLIFDLANNNLGLSNILTSSSLGKLGDGKGSENPNGVGQNMEIDPEYIRVLVSNLARKTPIPGLDLIPSGPSPNNPAELLGTVQMQTLVRALTEDIKYDVVIFDTPPTLTVSDTSILANITGGEVVVVVHAGRTRRASAARAVQQLQSLGSPVTGVILNRLHPRDVDAGYGGYYYYGYYGYNSYAYAPRPGQAALPPQPPGERPVPALPQVVRRRGGDDVPPPDA
ncbi:MAG: AAA family ATPase [Anaerolineales bacterium]|nr:AAA family ATPase [Anaerolineales bacterium]